jgi:hypothetical protein
MLRCVKVSFLLLFLVVPASILYGQSCLITSNFNGTNIPAGDYVWFNSVVSVRGVGQQTVNVSYTGGSITFDLNGVPQTVLVPNAQMTFSPAITEATTIFGSGGWMTNLQTSGLSGKDFLTAIAVPAGGWPGGIDSVSWTGAFTSDTPGITLQWQWAAAVYTQFGSDYNSLSVKPVDDNNGSQYKNSDHAGTPESFKDAVTGGARGGGGSNYTGSYSGTANCPVGSQSGPPQ